MNCWTERAKGTLQLEGMEADEPQDGFAAMVLNTTPTIGLRADIVLIKLRRSAEVGECLKAMLVKCGNHSCLSLSPFHVD